MVVRVVTMIEVYIKGDLEVEMETVANEDMVEEEADPPHVSIVVRLVMYHDYDLRHM
jgi:hypothetical protein